MKPSDLIITEYFEYFKQYIDLVDDIALVDALENGLVNTSKFFESLPESKLLYKYAEGKWTPKEILVHLIDTERVFCYRALYFARAEGSTLEGFDENIFGANCNANNRTIDNLLEEFSAVRVATICLFKSFSKDVLKRGGLASNKKLTVRAAGFIICGHELHHIKFIRDHYL
jgi:hypothetical protein